MANFKTHIQIATITAGFGATVLLHQKHISQTEAIHLWLLGTACGVLPDIDSDNSHCLAIIFWAVALIAAAATLLSQLDNLPLHLTLAVSIAAFLAIHFVARPIFEQITIHRGVLHSVLGTAFFSLMIVDTAHLLGSHATQSWLLGGFCALGCLTHLVLDELYSVDFMGAALKRSFGSALKLYDYGNYWTLFLMGGACIAMGYVAPDIQPVISLFTNQR